jgi:hypothetical protein
VIFVESEVEVKAEAAILLIASELLVLKSSEKENLPAEQKLVFEAAVEVEATVRVEAAVEVSKPLSRCQGRCRGVKVAVELLWLLLRCRAAVEVFEVAFEASRSQSKC